MSVEQYLLAALGIVTGWLVVAVKLLWSETVDCKKERATLRDNLLAVNIEVGKVKAELSHRNGRLEAYERCSLEKCPFKIRHTGDTPHA